MCVTDDRGELVKIDKPTESSSHVCKQRIQLLLLLSDLDEYKSRHRTLIAAMRGYALTVKPLPMSVCLFRMTTSSTYVAAPPPKILGLPY